MLCSKFILMLRIEPVSGREIARSLKPSSLAAAALALVLFQSQAPGSLPAAPSAAASPAASPTATTPAPPPAEVVKPIAELERLQFAAGDWVHDKEVDHGGTVGMPRLGAGRSKATWILKGHALHVLYKSKRADAEYEGRGIVGWDPETRRYRLDWFDSLGAARRFVGEFDPAGALVFSATFVPRAGQPVTQKVTIKKDRNNRFLILDERAIGNEPPTLYMESLAAPAPAPKAAAPSPEPTSVAPKPPISR
jgi:hypothetical protein